MKYKKSVYRSLALITQFGINMLVPIFLCVMAGIYIGALAGFRNIFIMAKKIYSEPSSKDTSVPRGRHRDGEKDSGHVKKD